MKKVILTFTGILFSIALFAGDILTLNNELVFEGKVTKIKNCSVSFKADGEKFVIPASDIFSIKFEDIENKLYTDFIEMDENASKNCLYARDDARDFHGKKGGHFFLGVLFGPFAMIGTLLSDCGPHKGKDTYMMSDNKEIFSDPQYLKCYKKKTKGQLIGMEAIGWAAWILVSLGLQGGS